MFAVSPAWLAAALGAIAVVLLVVLLARTSRGRTARLEAVLREEHRQMREAASRDAWELRDELASAQNAANQSVVTSVAELGRAQRDAIAGLEQRLAHQVDRAERHHDELRQGLEQRAQALQSAMDARLGEMRSLVDEKLQSTLERRLGESFRQVSERLEAVQKGLGEMQTLAAGVGDLKRVLTNVKTRGTWGEVQLGSLLEEILAPEQFARNVNTREGSDNRVEYAVRLPGEGGRSVWLPIDAKFPQEDYQRLVDAAEAADQAGVDASLAALVNALARAGRDIADKYLDPPRTTDFAIMFLPTEGLYAEALRQGGLVERLQRDHRVVVSGPTTLAALLNSLRMGFRTLAIERRSSEVWALLAEVKTEFERFGDQLARARRQLDLAAKAIDRTGTRTRAMARRLRHLETLPGQEDDAGSADGADDGEWSASGDVDGGDPPRHG